MSVFPPNKISMLVALIFTPVFTPNLHAEVITDGSVGAAQPLSGPDFIIPQSLGHTAGANLFHSFQSFNLAQPESATFTGSDNIQNVISRVTGGQASSIDGTLNSQVGQANFYFINPSGVVFGPNAQVNVPGDFHVSTANGLRFEDGSVFSAILDNASTLTMATPAEFGFLNDQSAAIRIEGSRLTFVEGSKVSLSAGSIQISGGELVKDDEGNVLTDDRSALISPAGDIHIQAIGDLQIDNALIHINGNRVGQIAISAGNAAISSSELTSVNTGNGAISSQSGIGIDTGLLEIKNTIITTQTLTAGNAGSITLVAANDIDLDHSQVWSITDDKGNSGAVTVTSGGLFTIRNGSIIGSNSLAEGNSNITQVHARNLTIDRENSERITGIGNSVSGTGNNNLINVTVENELSILNGGSITANTLADGHAGNINIKAEDITIKGEMDNNVSRITNSTDGSGNAGQITILAEHSLNLLMGGNIISSTSAKGNAGQITVQAGNLLLDSQDTARFSSSISSNSQSLLDNPVTTGHAGSVNIIVDDSLEILNGSTITTYTDSEGNAGTIDVQAIDITIQGGSAIDSSTEGSGDGGQVTVFAEQSLNIIDGGRIFGSTASQGNAGQITIQAGTLLIDDQNNRHVSGIYSDALGREEGVTGNAGKVGISVDGSLDILNGGKISSDTNNEGNAGNVIVQASDITIQSSQDLSRISSSTSGKGQGGQVNVSAEHSLRLTHGGNIYADTYSQGNAGEVLIQAGSLLIDGQDTSFVTDISSSTGFNTLSEATRQMGDAGEININVEGTLEVQNGGRILGSSLFNGGDAGKINVQAGNITIRGGKESFSSISSSSFDKGHGGSVTVSTEHSLHVLQRGDIKSNTLGEGNAGTVTIQAGNLLIDGEGVEASISSVSFNSLET